MHRDGRPLHLLAFLGVGLVMTLTLVGIDRLFVKPRPQAPQWAKCQTLAAWLHANDPDLRVVHPPGAAFCYAFDADVDPATLGELLPLEDYADCWRGAVQCVADAPPTYGVGPHACRAGDFWLFGDVELLARVRPAAEKIHIVAYRGTP